MTSVDEQGRPEPPVDGDEAATLLGFLDFHRATLAWKCADLDAAGLRATVAPSTMSLGGLLKHLAYVEDHWFSFVWSGHDRMLPFDAVDWTETPDWDWDSAVEDSPEQLRGLWTAAVERARAAVEDALGNGDLARRAQRPRGDGSTPNLRWILVHMVEEYSRHNGHADLIRESIDGSTGE